MAEYHQAPHTLDASREIPEDAAPSAGHSEEQAEKVRELNDEHAQGAEEAAQSASERAEAGTPEPPYEAGHDAGQPPEGEEGEASPKASEDVPDGTIAEVLDWVGDDPDRARQALEVERAGQNRSTLISELEARAG